MDHNLSNLFEIAVGAIGCEYWRFSKKHSHIGMWLITTTQPDKISVVCFDANYNVILTTNL